MCERTGVKDGRESVSEAMYLTAPASAVPPYGRAESHAVDGQAGRDGPSAPFAGVSNDYIISSIRSSLSFMGFLVSQPQSVGGEER